MAANTTISIIVVYCFTTIQFAPSTHPRTIKIPFHEALPRTVYNMNRPKIGIRLMPAGTEIRAPTVGTRWPIKMAVPP
jgi:hypothetical protein